MNPRKACKNFEKLSPEDCIKLEEIDYRKALIRSHGFVYNEYQKISKTVKKESILED